MCWAGGGRLEGLFFFPFPGHLEGSPGIVPGALLLPATPGEGKRSPSDRTSAREPEAGPVAPQSHFLLVSGSQRGLPHSDLDEIFWGLSPFVFHSRLLYI